MKLFEYQSKILMGTYGIPVPRGEVAVSPNEAGAAASRLGGTCVIKAQVLAGGRGKAGGVKIVHTPEEARLAAKDILAMNIQGLPVKRVLVAEAVDIGHEYYLSIVVNRDARRVEFVFSDAGGVDIEETARLSPEKILRVPIDPLRGPDDELLGDALRGSFEDGDLLAQAVAMARKVHRLFMEKDCSLVEINPLALVGGGRLVALDAKIIIDDNALYGHPDLEELRNSEEYGRDEMDARRAGLSFVGLDGTIGCMVNGAGLAMATMDLIKHFGGEPANFLDVGGSSNPQKVVDALEILLRNKRIRAILMNIFGGITRCDDIARGVIMAKGMVEIPVPFIIRLIGTNDELGKEMLRKEGIHAYTDLAEAVQRAIEASGSGR